MHYFLDLLGGWKQCNGNKPPPKFKDYKMMDYVNKVDTLHMICVLCEDSELTKANFQHMIRCDCKGYWKSRVCAHTLAIAHWYGEEFGLVDVESLNKVLPENAKPGRKRKHTPALQRQPDSPTKNRKGQPKAKVQTTPTGGLKVVKTRKKRR